MMAEGAQELRESACAVDASGGAKDVRMYCNRDALDGDVDVTIPTLTIRCESTDGAQQQFEQLQQLKKYLRRDKAAGQAASTVEFCLRTRREDDSIDFGPALAASAADHDTTVARSIIVDFLRSHLFDPWQALDPSLVSVHGRFYLFDPFIKESAADSVNTTWHQDGYSLDRGDDYFGHYYLPEDGVTGVGATDWLEVAIPSINDHADIDAPLVCARPFHTTTKAASPTTDAAHAAETSEEDDEEEELVLDWSGLSDDTRKERIAVDTFLALPTTSQSLILIHDAGCFHRVPLSALFRKPKRTIARLEFHGQGADCQRLLIAAPAAAERWTPMLHARLPSGLSAICSEYAAEGGNGSEEERRAEGLRAYIAGDVGFKAWLEQCLTRRFGELPVASTELA